MATVQFGLLHSADLNPTCSLNPGAEIHSAELVFAARNSSSAPTRADLHSRWGWETTTGTEQLKAVVGTDVTLSSTAGQVRGVGKAPHTAQRTAHTFSTQSERAYGCISKSGVGGVLERENTDSFCSSY